MTQSITEWLQQNRLIVVAVDPDGGRLRLRNEAEACTDFNCGEETVVTTEDGVADLGAINAGDIVRVEASAGRARRIVVVRRVWDELTSPEF
jgi:hypothetical protein